MLVIFYTPVGFGGRFVSPLAPGPFSYALPNALISRRLFLCLPPIRRGEGKNVFIANENNSIFREVTTSNTRTGTSVPPELNAFLDKYLHFQDDASVMPFWSIVVTRR